MDVGSGPITSLGYVSKRFDITITATDPLADAYTVLLNEAEVTPPVRTQKCFGENLLEHFGSRRFHVCHSSNALDHSLDPRTILIAMAQLLHPQGLMYVRVYRNEGKTRDTVECTTGISTGTKRIISSFGAVPRDTKSTRIFRISWKVRSLRMAPSSFFLLIEKRIEADKIFVW